MVGGYTTPPADPNLTNVTFKNNSVTWDGGGMYNDNSSPTLTQVMISANTALNGSGIHNTNTSNPTLVNVILHGNIATYGGGVLNDNSSPVLTNVTISGNAAHDGGGMYSYNSSSPTIQNSILWGNTATTSGDQIYNDSSTPTYAYSLIEGMNPGGTNFNGTSDNNPLFVSPVAAASAPTTDGDYRLQSGSPAINIGDNNADLDDIGSGTQTISDIATDLDGDARIINSTVDLGAYEWHPQIYVNHAATGTNDGSSWANAYTDLQDALIVAVADIHEIWVAQGTYYPGVNRTDSFAIKNGVAVYGGFAATELERSERDWESNVTVLSGDIGTLDDISDNSYHVIYNNGLADTAILDGFTVTGGNADGSDSDDNGGGIYNTNSNPTLNNLIVSSNSADFYGGGIYNTSS